MKFYTSWVFTLTFLSLFQLQSAKWFENGHSRSRGRSGWGQDTPEKDQLLPSQVTRRLQRYDPGLDPARARLHPLDPLTESEINTTSTIIRNFRNGDWLFTQITLKEPEKSTLLPYFLNDQNPPALTIPRRAFAVVLDRSSNQAFEITINLDTRQVETWERVPNGQQPPFTPEELIEAERIIREDPTVQERSRRLGWTDMQLVNGDPWSMGYVGDRPEYRDRGRLMQLYLYGKNFEGDNEYAHPFDFVVIVDMNESRVIAIEELPTHDDYDANNKVGNIVPRRSSNYAPELRDPNSFRNDIRPVNVSQPAGTSFTITGNEIKWQKFKMRVGFNGRESVVLYNVNYNDDGKVRPLFYRMSLAEMFVPYGDPRPPYHRKHVFDETEYGTGFSINELQPQVDCIGEVLFIDAVLHNDAGEAQRIPRAICVHEEDAGILWKHTDYRTGRASVVRSQRLALTFIATVGNYDYLFSWYFYQDATIEFNVKLSGILSVHMTAVNATGAGHGTIVFPQINAQYHQHFFSLRLDAEIDGNQNSVVVSDVVPGPGQTGSAQNPYGQGFTTRTRLLRTAGSARTRVAPENSRTWHIRNPNQIHPYTKQPVAWKIIPWPSPQLMMQKDSPIHPLAEWMEFNTWVTPYKEDQFFPAGNYINGSGLPEWVDQDQNANVHNRDIVVWHNFGISHVPRVEDFPVMPVETCGVILKPMNFFKENPALDVPPPRPRDRSEL